MSERCCGEPATASYPDDHVPAEATDCPVPDGAPGACKPFEAEQLHLVPIGDTDACCGAGDCTN